MRRTPHLDAALRECGAVLLREHNHRVYLLPNGQKFTCAKSGSDVRAERNALRNLKRALAQPMHLSSTQEG